MTDAISGEFLNDSQDFLKWFLGIAHKKGLQPTMTVDGRPILLIRIGRGERI
jgi:hypothetical protein